MDARLAEIDRYDPNEDEWDGYLMANLRPRHTGLPMVVWVQHKGRARHDARVKVAMSHGDVMDIDNLAVVAVRPEPRLLHGELERADLDAVQRWIRLNETAILRHWNGETDTADLLAELQSL